MEIFIHVKKIVQSAKIISNKAEVISLNLFSPFVRTCKKKKKSLCTLLYCYTLLCSFQSFLITEELMVYTVG
jgi:hypothetical protein